jgi:transposase-like protein
MKCRQCGSDNAHRSRIRSDGEQLITKLTPLRYWRCHDCNFRFRAKKSRDAKTRRMRIPRRRLMKYLRIAAIVLAAAVGAYFVLSPYLELSKPVSRHH